MKTILALAIALTASTAYAGPPLNCPGNSCNAPGHNGPVPLPTVPSISLSVRDNVSVLNRQHNAAPVVSAISGVTIRATAGRNSAARISGNTISATAVGNSSVIRITRRR